ncbi:MAG: hypothetical protein O9327_16045 [Polaromonas sp.]|nr:hypothetical protein [Polaromonas sp.]
MDTLHGEIRVGELHFEGCFGPAPVMGLRFAGEFGLLAMAGRLLQIVSNSCNQIVA